MKIRPFGQLSDGSNAGLYIIKNSKGMAAAVTDVGASLTDLIVPDRHGEMVDVVLGYDEGAAYETRGGSVGGTVGRFANRIGGAAFTINRQSYKLTANNGPNACHGGRDFYVRRKWEARVPFDSFSSGDIMASFAAESIGDARPALPDKENESITFSLDSPDGDQGFPGNLHIEVTYTVTENNELRIDYFAQSDEDTPLNLTNHSYFNLSGHDSGSVLGHIAQIHADRYTATDEWSLPTGEKAPVSGTPMDFREPKALGRDIDQSFDALKFGNGYDHNYIVSEDFGELKEVASLYSEYTGISMTVLTDLPGMQLYTANSLKNMTGKDLVMYGPRMGVCMETQFWPDAVNREDFPGGILYAGDKFRSTTIYRFGLGPHFR